MTEVEAWYDLANHLKAEVDRLRLKVAALQGKLAALNLCDPQALDKAYREIQRLKEENIRFERDAVYHRVEVEELKAQLAG